MVDLHKKIENLRKTIHQNKDFAIDYMSDTKNWVCIHTTKYAPKRNDADKLYIKTTAMATDYKLPRATIHVTLNQVVGNHIGGSWDTASIVILAPYNDVISQNNNPQEVAAEDTYFIPNPDTGLILPDTTYIIQPSSDNKELFTIGEKGATYKTDQYTPEEVEEILSLSDWDKSQYEEYLSGNIPEYEIESILGYDEKLIQTYQNSEDKKAFMRGILEEDRFIILNKLLRDAVVKLSLEEMGYHYIFAHEDIVSAKIANVATDSGLRGNSGNKGHSSTLEYETDLQGCALAKLSEVLNSQNPDKICKHLANTHIPMRNEVISSILSDTPIPDTYQVFIEVAKSKNVNLSDYNAHLDTTLHRHADKITEECNNALNKIKQNPENYAKLKQRLKQQQDMAPQTYIYSNSSNR